MNEIKSIIGKISKQGKYLMIYIPKKFEKNFKLGEHIVITKLLPNPLSIIANISKHGEYLTIYIPKEYWKRFKPKEKVVIGKLFWKTN